MDAGCVFAIDSDAHAARELSYTDYAMAQARLARLPSARVINCWGDAELFQWMRAAWDR
jgi:putative hydrolase